MPTNNKKFILSIHYVSLLMLIIYIVSLVPMLCLGQFNWPSTDDFSMALQTHEAWTSSGSILTVLKAAVAKTAYLYFNWIGYYFSAFLTTLSPSIFNETFSSTTPAIILLMLTVGVFSFFNAFLVKLMDLKKDYATITSVIALFMLIQCMPRFARVEAFYWYSGAINYMFMFGLALFYESLIIKTICCPPNVSRLIITSLLAILLGGCNYMTALTLAIISTATIIVYNSHRNKGLLIPCILNILGFFISVIAPGNKIRSAEGSGLSAVEAILQSFEKVLTVCINEYVRWDVIVLFLILCVVFWHIAPHIKHRFKHPVLVFVIAFCIISANNTPPLYATGNIAAPRICSIIYAQFIILSIIECFYIVVWIHQTFFEEYEVAKTAFSEKEIKIIVALSVVMLLTSIFFITVEPHYYSASSAVHDLVSGSAQTYRAENLERLEQLKDTENASISVSEFSQKPDLLFHEDVYPDASEWVNTAVARYYNKESISLIPCK